MLSRYRGRTLVEFCRRPAIEERIAGFVIDFSDALILLHRLDWDTFSLNGYVIVRDDDIVQKRFFSRTSYWQYRAIEKLRLRPKPVPGLKLMDWPEAMESVSSKFQLITIHREIKRPDECYIGRLLHTTEKTVVIDNLDTCAEWTGPRRFKLHEVTRLDFEGGYERALALTAPIPKRPHGFFKNAYTKREAESSNRLAKYSVQRLVD